MPEDEFHVPQHTPRTNLNTWVSLGTAAAMVIGFSITIGAFRADTEAGLLDVQSDVAELKVQASATSSRFDGSIQNLEEAVNALNVRDARNDERMNSILETLRRIDAKLTAQDLRENGGKP